MTNAEEPTQVIPPLIHIIGEDYYNMRKRRGDPIMDLPRYSPGPCIICGAPDSNCTGHITSSRYDSLQPGPQGDGS